MGHHHGNAAMPGFGHGDFNREQAGDLAKVPAAINDSCGFGFFFDTHGRSRNNHAAIGVADVLRNADHAVRVVAHQVGGHQVLGYGRRFVERGACGLENSGDGGEQFLFANDLRHYSAFTAAMPCL
jgi:hypothetical protein